MKNEMKLNESGKKRKREVKIPAFLLVLLSPSLLSSLFLPLFFLSSFSFFDFFACSPKSFIALFNTVASYFLSEKTERKKRRKKKRERSKREGEEEREGKKEGKQNTTSFPLHHLLVLERKHFERRKK